MRRSRLHPLIALLCALFLLGAQQAAYAHFLGHLGIAAESVMQEHGDAGHGAAASLAHVCTTCAAFAALDAAPGLAGSAPRAEPPPRLDLPESARPQAPTDPAPPYASRAPPVPL